MLRATYNVCAHSDGVIQRVIPSLFQPPHPPHHHPMFYLTILCVLYRSVKAAAAHNAAASRPSPVAPTELR